MCVDPGVNKQAGLDSEKLFSILAGMFSNSRCECTVVNERRGAHSSKVSSGDYVSCCCAEEFIPKIAEVIVPLLSPSIVALLASSTEVRKTPQLSPRKVTLNQNSNLSQKNSVRRASASAEREYRSSCIGIGVLAAVDLLGCMVSTSCSKTILKVFECGIVKAVFEAFFNYDNNLLHNHIAMLLVTLIQHSHENDLLVLFSEFLDVGRVVDELRTYKNPGRRKYLGQLYIIMCSFVEVLNNPSISAPVKEKITSVTGWSDFISKIFPSIQQLYQFKVVQASVPATGSGEKS